MTLFGSHLIDLITYLTGQRAIRIHGVTKTFTSQTSFISGTRRITATDFAVIQMEMDGGIQYYFRVFGISYGEADDIDRLLGSRYFRLDESFQPDAVWLLFSRSCVVRFERFSQSRRCEDHWSYLYQSGKAPAK